MPRQLIPLDAGERRLTAVQFQQLAEVPAAVEWFANIDNPRTRRAYKNDLEDFCGFVGLAGAGTTRSALPVRGSRAAQMWRFLNRKVRQKAAFHMPHTGPFPTSMRVTT